jgi:hypothetical protein
MVCSTEPGLADAYVRIVIREGVAAVNGIPKLVRLHELQVK